jgi:hypothetical protein
MPDARLLRLVGVGRLAREEAPERRRPGNCAILRLEHVAVGMTRTKLPHIKLKVL